VIPHACAMLTYKSERIVLPKAVTFLTLIQNMFGSTLDWDTEYTEVLHVFPQSLRSNSDIAPGTVSFHILTVRRSEGVAEIIKKMQ
jgi:hypothetical protein